MKLLSNYIIAIMCRVRPQGQGVPEITTLQGGGTKGGYFGNNPGSKGSCTAYKTMPACDGRGIMLANHASTYKLRFGVEVITRVGQFSYFLRES